MRHRRVRVMMKSLHPSHKYGIIHLSVACHVWYLGISYGLFMWFSFFLAYNGNPQVQAEHKSRDTEVNSFTA